jgi:hypothetical protein
MGRNVRDKTGGVASPASGNVAGGDARRAHARPVPRYRVIDDFASELPVSEAELAVIETFLGPLLRAILADEEDHAEPKSRVNGAQR